MANHLHYLEEQYISNFLLDLIVNDYYPEIDTDVNYIGFKIDEDIKTEEQWKEFCNRIIEVYHPEEITREISHVDLEKSIIYYKSVIKVNARMYQVGWYYSFAYGNVLETIDGIVEPRNEIVTKYYLVNDNSKGS